MNKQILTFVTNLNKKTIDNKSQVSIILHNEFV